MLFGEIGAEDLHEVDIIVYHLLAVLTAVLVGIAKTGISGMAILVVPLIALVFTAKESVGALLPMLIAGLSSLWLLMF